MLTSSCPVLLCVLLALITVIGVTGDVSDTKSVPPSVRMPPQSRYKSLIAAITSIKKNPVYIPS
ncbi:unnamed protein product, partial [Staurois parvus]